MSNDDEWVTGRVEAARSQGPALPEGTIEKVRELMAFRLQERELPAKARKELAKELLETLFDDEEADPP